MVRSFARTIDALVARLDAWQQEHPRAGFVYAVFRKYADDEVGHRAALLAYYGFLSIFPSLLVLTTLFRIWLGHEAAIGNKVIQAVVNYFPAIGADLQHNVHTLDRTGVALILGIALALFGARGVADILRNSLDHIWQVPFARRSRFLSSLARSFVIIVVGGFGLAVTPVVFGYTLAFAPSRLFGVLSTTLTAVVLFWVLVLIIKIGSSRRMPLKRIWLGSFVAVLLLTLLQSAGGYIMAREIRHLDSLYGTFALVLGLIFWLYLQTQVLLLSFEIDAVRAFKLWPRSLQPPLTPADHAAYELYQERARYHDAG